MNIWNKQFYSEQDLLHNNFMFSSTKSWKQVRYYLSLGLKVIFKDTRSNSATTLVLATSEIDLDFLRVFGYSDFAKWFKSNQCKICNTKDKTLILSKIPEFNPLTNRFLPQHNESTLDWFIPIGDGFVIDPNIKEL